MNATQSGHLKTGLNTDDRIVDMVPSTPLSRVAVAIFAALMLYPFLVQFIPPAIREYLSASLR
jgi:hypothetical protein